ncbi:MAG: DUF58 domain-containing protein [Planctomycetota bacterium]
MKRTPLKLDPRASSGLGSFLLLLGWATCFCGGFFGHGAVLTFGLIWSFVCIAVYVAVRLAARQLAVTRIVRATAFEDEAVTVELLLENRSRLPVFFPRITEIFVPEAHEQKELVLTDRLMPGETVRGHYRGYCILPRGVYSYGPTMLRISDPFGWFEVRRLIDNEQEIRVYPAISDVQPADDLGDVLTQLCSERVRIEAGSLDETIGVREYRPGDSPRWIHWGLTAQHNRPVVREFARPLLEDLHIFVDIGRESLVGTGRSSSIDTALRISASVAASALRQGRRVAFTAGCDEGNHVPAAAGDTQLHAILETMVMLRAREELPYGECMENYDADIAAGATVLLFVSPYLYGDPDLALRIRRLAVRGARVQVVVFEESSFCAVWQGVRSATTLDIALAQLRRSGARCYLARCGVDVRHVLAVPETA